jgi:outer membrane protein assembly factor BamB
MVSLVLAASLIGPARAADEGPPAAAARVAALLEDLGVCGGLVVHVGCDDAALTAALRVDDRFLVHGLDTDAEQVQAARQNLLRRGIYGPVSIDTWDGRRLPYADNLVRLLVIGDPSPVGRDEILRVLCPGGAAVKLDRETRAPQPATLFRKPWPAEIDQWTHFLHGPDNNAVAADQLAGEPRSVQWISGPQFGRSHEELASMSTAVTAAGRIFFIVDDAPFASIRFRGQWQLVARDAFSGVLLWRREIPLWTDHLRHFRSGPVHLQRRLVAGSDQVYTTLGLGAPVSALSAASGQTERVYEGTEHTEEILVSDGVLYLAVGTSERVRLGGGLYTRDEPGTTNFRFIVAVEAASGRRLWKHDFGPGESLLPLTLAVDNGSVYFQSTAGVTRLEAGSGRRVWQTPRATLARRLGFSAPTLVVAEDVVLCADREPVADKPDLSPAVDGRITWGVHGWNEPSFARSGPSKLRAYAVDSGRELWSAECSEQYNSPTDVFVVDGVAWVGSNFRGYDLQTGELVRELRWRGDPVAMPHHRCYRNKATENYLFTGRSGIEVVSFADGWLGNNSWVRGTCQYGILPANGLVYAPPNACACYNKVKVLGFFAAAPARQDGPSAADAVRLERGPAYDGLQALGQSAVKNGDDDWPMYRHDPQRSGHVATAVPDRLQRRWTTKLGGRLSQPIAAGGLVFLAATDSHTVYALRGDDGRPAWSFTAGGRVDSSPTFYRGLILFGSADGWVYCLRADDGRLGWRYRVAPHVRLVGAFDQLESAWPVHGSVLVQDDTLYVTAGRNSYLDGGLELLRLDPFRGAVLSRTNVYHLDPETGRQTGAEGSGGFDMEGVRSDLLSGDGQSVFLKHFGFDREGRQLAETAPHLFAVDGFLDDEWFVRTYWIYGTNVTAGWGGWANAASSHPFGRILAMDDQAIFGYGRTAISSGPTGHRADTYHLWRRDRDRLLAAETPADEPEAKSSAGKRKPKSSAGKPKPGRKALAPPAWSDLSSLIVRAMALTPGKLLVAGPPDLGRKSAELLAYDNPDEALAGFRGERGVSLRIVDRDTGSTLAEHLLTAMPVFDGLSVAQGRVLIALQDGTVECWGSP